MHDPEGGTAAGWLADLQGPALPFLSVQMVCLVDGLELRFGSLSRRRLKQNRHIDNSQFLESDEGNYLAGMMNGLAEQPACT